jgi:hypothetical protein
VTVVGGWPGCVTVIVAVELVGAVSATVRCESGECDAGSVRLGEDVGGADLRWLPRI